MGQTLTHGIYLPDEGERNCYSGLAGNWQLLDGAVGTIAEHTSQIAGKAPLVHTHTKSDITDFPAYGNTAGTICEGNDSRLSDARTPVAHTHLTADVTDLLNSAHTWSGEQTFSQTIQGNAATATEFASNQSVTLTGTIEGTASSKAGWTIATDFREGVGFRTTTDFYAKLASGSFSGGWNVYNAIFMCNSTERFETCVIQLGLRLNQSGIVDSSSYAQLIIRSINGLVKTRFVLVYKNDTNRVLFELYAYNPSNNHGITAKLLNEFIRNGNKQSINIQMHSNVVVNALPDGYTVVNAETALTANDFIPSANNSYDLGTSTNKWKTLNGVNPGALSLPDYNNYLDVTSNIPIASLDGTTQINLNDYLADKTGWLSIVIDDSAGNSILVVQGRSSGSTFINSRSFHSGSQSGGYISVFIPVIAGLSKPAFIKASNLIQMRFYYCQGNV